MYSEEEKKAIEMLKQLKFKNGISFCDQCVYSNKKKCFTKTTDCQKQVIKIILNLIDKQDKIINEVKSKLEAHIKVCEQEASISLNSGICDIALNVDKCLLNLIEKQDKIKA